MINEIFLLTTVALLWGITNPLIKKGTTDIKKVHSTNKLKQFFLELKYLFSNVNYIIPMGINQIGSLLYFYTLQDVEISLVVPIANSLTFVFTAITGWILNEGIPTKRTCFGVFLVLLGVALMYIDKYLQVV